MKSLIAYFSLSGTTKQVAQRIKNVTDADLFEIKGNKNYDSYLKAVVIGGKEILIREKTVVTTHIENFNEYDRIMIGFPIWYGDCPRIIRTFIEEYDFSNKDVYIFCTSGSSNCDKALKTVKKICTHAHIHSAIRFDHPNDHDIKSWLNE